MNLLRYDRGFDYWWSGLGRWGCTETYTSKRRSKLSTGRCRSGRGLSCSSHSRRTYGLGTVDERSPLGDGGHEGHCGIDRSRTAHTVSPRRSDAVGRVATARSSNSSSSSRSGGSNSDHDGELDDEADTGGRLGWNATRTEPSEGSRTTAVGKSEPTSSTADWRVEDGEFHSYWALIGPRPRAAQSANGTVANCVLLDAARPALGTAHTWGFRQTHWRHAVCRPIGD